MYRNIHQSAICNGKNWKQPKCALKGMGELIIFIMEEDCQGSLSLLSL